MTEPVRTLTPITSGNTFQEWIASRDPKASKVNPMLESVFNLILEVPGFIENFHCAENEVQMHIIHMLVSGSKCPIFTNHYLRLLQETDNISLISDRSADFGDPEIESMTGIFFGQIVSGSGIKYRYLKPIAEVTVLKMLREKYGDDRVNEVMQYWVENEMSGYFCEFLQFFEAWEEVCDYPADWGMNISRSHVCNDLTIYRESVIQNFRKTVETGARKLIT